MLTVLVCGGRYYNDRGILRATLDGLDASLAGGIVRIIHGGATGADAMAGEWAGDHGVRCTVFGAQWAKFGKAAGPMRNAMMLEEGQPDLVVAFPGGRGTANMIEQARASGVRVWEPMTDDVDVIRARAAKGGKP